MAKRALVHLVALAVVLVAGASVARADADPASDILYTGRVFFPYSTTIAGSAQKQLLETVEASEKNGYPIRVALIAGRQDLGAVTSLWDKPRRYATFLGFELSFVYKGPLLIVMPAGFGFEHYKQPTAPEYRALAGIPITADGSGLAIAAESAVRRLAARAGHPVPAPGGGSSFPLTLVLAAALSAIGLAAAAGVVLRLRRRSAG